MTASLQYVVITPARNERQFIEYTLDSMAAQTRLPLRWVIVSDGSTDGTDDVVRKYQDRYPWIELVRLADNRPRSFAGKVDSFNAGLRQVKSLSFDLLANLDADLAFKPGYFDYIVSQFEERPDLGVAGTPFLEAGRHYDYSVSNIEHVSGACQVFRRRCFEDINGYQPIPGGGVDWVAVTTARMKGWQTRTFTDMTCEHLRPMGTAARGRLSVDFHHGQRDYYLGGHPLWQVLRAVNQTRRRPYGFGGVSLLAGYIWALIWRTNRPVSPELVEFHRKEQMRRLRTFMQRPLSRWKSADR